MHGGNFDWMSRTAFFFAARSQITGSGVRVYFWNSSLSTCRFPVSFQSAFKFRIKIMRLFCFKNSKNSKLMDYFISRAQWVFVCLFSPHFLFSGIFFSQCFYFFNQPLS